MTAKNQTHYDNDARLLLCTGDWCLASLPELQAMLDIIAWPKSGDITFDGKAILKMDSAGAWLLYHYQEKLEQAHLSVKLENFSSEQLALLSLIKKRASEEAELAASKHINWITKLGKSTVSALTEFREYLAFVGQLAYEAQRIVLNPRRWRWAALAGVIYRNGYQALPIIALLSFMIGVVMTYQMGLQLRNYGANVYIVDLLGLAILREFGPLITAIMVAGRTGSAFTAQLGMMKLNQEIDALDTLGVTPAELLLLPRILGLVITLPLLTMWANIFGVFGGMVMANNMLNITWYDFMHRFPSVIPLKSLLLGLGKTPIFALIIASVACFQGMLVQGSADSLGRNTTRSVVLAIFFIIIADAIFSILFSKLQL